MFGKTRVIIVITKDKLFAAKVKLPSKKITQALEVAWNFETLELALATIKKEFKANNVRILFAKDVSYVLRVKIPAEVGEEGERNFVAEKINTVRIYP